MLSFASLTFPAGIPNIEYKPRTRLLEFPQQVPNTDIGGQCGKARRARIVRTFIGHGGPRDRASNILVRVAVTCG